MSKLRQTIFFSAGVFALILQFFNNCPAQTVETKVKIEASVPSSVNIQGKYSNAAQARPVRNFSFLQSYAGTENLGVRVSDVLLSDQANRPVNYRKLQAGEFLAESEFSGWQYKVETKLPPNSPSAAHISSVSGEQGILMLDDLLPQFGEKTAARISFELPAGWEILTTENKIGELTFETADVEKAIFYVGKNLRQTAVPIGRSQLNLIFSGDNQFSDDEAAKMASEIFGFYEKLFGAGSPPKRFSIFLGKLTAGNQDFGRWEAETRGTSTTVFSSGMAFKAQSLQLLHEQLRHEIFHFWMPNDLNLSGSYDWFYEGFALYQALRIGISVNRIRFEDFLDTLARAQTIDNFQTPRVSLIEASKNRWNGANTQIYARGMLIAFLCDIALLQQSKGDRSLDLILRQIYDTHRFPNARTDGSEAILKIMRSREELRPIVEKYIAGAENIDWKNYLAGTGIEATEENFSTKLQVKAKPNGREKDFLEKLGYNNWRKLSPKTK